MDFPQIIRALRGADDQVHIAAAANLLFLCARAFRHLPPQFDPFQFTTTSTAASVGGGEDGNAAAPASPGAAAASSSPSTADATATMGDFSRHNSSTLNSILSPLSPTEFEVISNELKNVLRIWPSHSKAHKVLVSSLGGSLSNDKSSGDGFSSSSSRIVLQSVPIIEVAQQWVDTFPPSSYGGEISLADDARDRAVETATQPVTANPAAVIQTITAASVLPHMCRDVTRALLLCLKLVPVVPLPGASLSSTPSSPADAKKQLYWFNNMLHFADSLVLKRATMTNELTIQTAEGLLKETIARGMFNSSDGNEGNSEFGRAAWTHLLVVWASLCFDRVHRQAKKNNDTVGILADPEAQVAARRRSPIFSLSVRRVVTSMLRDAPADVVKYVFSFCTGDASVVEKVDEALASTSLPMRTRSYTRGRLAVASAIIFYAQNKNSHTPLDNTATAASSSPSSSATTLDSDVKALRIPLAFLHSAVIENHPGLLSEVWPPVLLLSAPSFTVDYSSKAVSEAHTYKVEFCANDSVEDIVGLVTAKLPQLRTTPPVVKDLVMLSQLAVSPDTFSKQLRLASSSIQWSELLDCLASNSQNLTPAACESIYAPAVAQWWCQGGADDALKKADLVGLLETISRLYTSKCSSGNERAALFSVLAAVLRRAGASVLDSAITDDAGSNAAVACFRQALASPSTALLNAAWSAFSLLPSSFQASSTITPFLKPLVATNASESQKRAVLAFADPAVKLDALHSTLLDDVESEVLTALPDAFLTLAFGSSAAREKLAEQSGGASRQQQQQGGSDDDSDSDAGGGDNANGMPVKAWAASPECVSALLHDTAPGEAVFDPAVVSSGAATATTPSVATASSPTTTAAAASSSAAGASNNRTARLGEANSALSWAVVRRGLDISKMLVDQHLQCGPLISFLCARRGFIRELASRLVLGGNRLRNAKQLRQLERERRQARRDQLAAATAAVASGSDASAAAAASSSGQQQQQPVAASSSTSSAVSLLDSAPRALNAWKYLCKDLLPFLERRYVSAQREACGAVCGVGSSGGFNGSMKDPESETMTAPVTGGVGGDASMLVSEMRPIGAVTILARSVVKHISLADPGELLSSILVACSHPAIAGTVDLDFEIPSNRCTGKYRPDTITQTLRTAAAIFGEPMGASGVEGARNSKSPKERGGARIVNQNAQLLAENAVAVSDALCRLMTAECDDVVSTAAGGMGTPAQSTASRKSNASSSKGNNKNSKAGGNNKSRNSSSANDAAAAATKRASLESKRSAGRAFALLQAYLDDDSQSAASTQLLSVLRDTVTNRITTLDAYTKAAFQPSIKKAITKIIDVDLFKKGLLKNQEERAPKGVKQEDWEDRIRRDLVKAVAARDEKLKQIVENSLLSSLDRVASLLVPFAAVRHLAGLRSPLVSLDSISALLPYLMEVAHNARENLALHIAKTSKDSDNIAAASSSPIGADADYASGSAAAAAASSGGDGFGGRGDDDDEDGGGDTYMKDGKVTSKTEADFASYSLLAECAEDAACSLLRCTPLAPTAHCLVRVYRLLGTRSDTFDAQTVAEANAFAHALRVSVPRMLPAELMPPLLLLARRFFRVFKRRRAKQPSAAAQHQFMSVLATCFGDRNISGKRDAAELLFVIIENFFGLHRMAINSITALCGHLSVDEAVPVTRALLTGTDLGREAAIAGLDRFSKQLNLSTRIGGILASAACYDEKASVVTAAKTLVASLKFTPDADLDWPLVSDLLQRYSDSASATNMLASFALETARAFPDAVALWLPSILLMPRAAAVCCLDKLAPVFDDGGVVRALQHLIAIVEDSTTDPTTIRNCSKAGTHILQECRESAISGVISHIKPLLKKSTSTVVNHRELHNGANIALLTALATRTNDTTELNSVLDEVVAMSNASQTANVHRTACDCIRRLASTPLLRRSDKIVEIGSNALRSIMTSTVYAKKKGHAYIVTGIASGAGLLYLRKTDFLKTLNDAARDRQQQRIAAMILIECACEVIGEMFEPYALTLTQLLIDGIAEKDEKISECANDAAKAFMRCFSEAGLHQLIPRLIDALSNETNTKKRAPALNLIGYTAFCSPKQLVATLPSIMKHIIDALCDANSAISRAAYNALRRVAGVVSNQEIKEHVEVLIEAMRNPATDTENALDALLYTKFFTHVDPASLAILSPVVLRGLAENSSTIRGKASQVVGSLVKLVSEEKSLFAYGDEFIDRLQIVVQDPDAGVRSTAAKAMAGIAASINDDKVLHVIAWCLDLLARASSSAERSGAAESLCEAISKGGPARFGELHAQIEKGLTSDAPNTREGFINIIVYTPSAFSEAMFAPLLPTLFQWVLTGLGDTTEQVRTMALKAGSTIITGYGTRTLQFVLGPLVDGVTSEISSTRQACLLLTSKLIVHLVQVLRRQHKLKHQRETGIEDDSESDKDDGAGEDGGDERNDENAAASASAAISAREAERGIAGFSVLNALKETIGDEKFVRILAALHMARHEHNANVRAEVHTAWTIAVSSIRTAVNLCIQGLVDLCVCFASSDNPECNDLAERILEFTSQRLHETLDVFLLSFSKQYEVDSLRHKVGALASMAEVVPCCDPDRIQRLGPYLVNCVLNGLQHTDERVRTNAGAVFDRVSKIAGGKWIDSMVEQQLGTSVVGVVELVRVRPVSSLASVFKAFSTKEDKDVTPHDVRLLKGLIELDDTRQELVKHYDRICAMLLGAERQGIPDATSTMTVFADSLLTEYCPAPIADIDRALKLPNLRAAALRSAAAFFFGIRAKYTDHMEQVLRLVIHHLADLDDGVRDASARALQQMIASLDSKASQTFTTEEKSDALLAKGATGRYALNFLEMITSSLTAIIAATVDSNEKVFRPFTNPAVFDTLFTQYYLKYVDHGRAPQKVLALEGILQVLSRAKTEQVVPCLVSIGGKCVRFLTSKQEGIVLSATMNLVDFLMGINGGGKEVVFENTLAASLCATMLSDSNEAKILADTVAIRLVRKNTANAEKLLGGIGARKAQIETESHRTSLCRFIAIIIRVAQMDRKAIALGPLFTLVKGFFESPESTSNVAAAAGSCLGAMLMSPSINDADVVAVAEKALAQSKAKGAPGAQTVAGMACVASILNAPKSCARVASLSSPFLANIASVVQTAIEGCAADRVVTAWTLRLVSGAIARGAADSAVLGDKNSFDALKKIAQSLHRSDDMLHCALHHIATMMQMRIDGEDTTAGAAAAASGNAAAASSSSSSTTNPLSESETTAAEAFINFVSQKCYSAKSTVCENVALYDADLEDESGASTVYY